MVIDYEQPHLTVVFCQPHLSPALVLATMRMECDTPMFLSSLSKSILLWHLLQQIKTGRVDLDDPVIVYSPGLTPGGHA
jgi:hypothetical protein